MWINKTDQKHHACWLGNRLKKKRNRGGGPLGLITERVGGALDQGGSGGGGRRF